MKPKKIKKWKTSGCGSWSWLQIALFSVPPPSAGKKLDVNRDKQEAHLSLPHLHTKTTKAEGEKHWVLEIVCYALSFLPAACSPDLDMWGCSWMLFPLPVDIQRLIDYAKQLIDYTKHGFVALLWWKWHVWKWECMGSIILGEICVSTLTRAWSFFYLIFRLIHKKNLHLIWTCNGNAFNTAIRPWDTNTVHWHTD